MFGTPACSHTHPAAPKPPHQADLHKSSRNASASAHCPFTGHPFSQPSSHSLFTFRSCRCYPDRSYYPSCKTERPNFAGWNRTAAHIIHMLNAKQAGSLPSLISHIWESCVQPLLMHASEWAPWLRCCVGISVLEYSHSSISSELAVWHRNRTIPYFVLLLCWHRIPPIGFREVGREIRTFRQLLQGIKRNNRNSTRVKSQEMQKHSSEDSQNIIFNSAETLR